MTDGMTEEVNDCVDYLRTGGMGETFGLADMARQMGEPKVQMDTSMALALCFLANKALDQIEAEMKAGWPGPRFGQVPQ
jgi:hypothetical protein